jgi:hypothetical protein
VALRTHLEHASDQRRAVVVYLHSVLRLPGTVDEGDPSLVAVVDGSWWSPGRPRGWQCA